MVQTGMIFAMVFVLILIGFLLTVGFSQIQSFLCLGSNAQTSKAIKDLTSVVEEVAFLAKGSAKEYRLSLPGDTKVCFVNTDDPRVRPYTDTKKTWNPDPLVISQFISNPQSSSYHSNIWVHFCGNSFGEGRKIRSLSTEESFCAVGGNTLFLQNIGPAVEISIK